MPFEINLTNENGKFHVILQRNVSKQQVLELATLATNIITDIRQNLPIMEDRVYGPHTQQHYQNRTDSGNLQTKLGEQIITINEWNERSWIGAYKEPESGCRLQILSFPIEGKMKAVKALRDLTNMTVKGAQHIIYGNFLCPLLTREVADKMMVVLREHNIHAKIIVQE